jgi:hypothetical protein
VRKRFALKRLGGLVMALSALLATAPAVFADEIGDVGDTDSIGDIYRAGDGHATLKVDYVHDCPPGVTGCDIRVRFRYKCPEFWCGGWSYQGWKSVGAPVNGIGTVSADCPTGGSGNNENYWEADYEIRWWSTSSITEKLTGEYEAYIDATGSIAYRLIPEAASTIKAGVSAGIQGSYTISTTTSTAQTWATGTVATSRGSVLNTCTSP